MPSEWTAASRSAWREHLTHQQEFSRQLSAILRDAARDAERAVRRLAPEPGVGAATRRAQYRATIAVLRRQSAELFGDISKGMEARIAEAGEDAAAMIRAISTVLAEGVEEELAAGFLGAADHAIENVTSRLLDRTELSRQVYRTQKLADGWVDRAINRGIATNRSAAEIAAEVRDLIRPDVRGGVDYAARRLARTEINNAFHLTSVRSAEEQPWVEGMKWNLSGSHPHPDRCDEYAHSNQARMGMGVFRPGSIPRKPHPQCLCYTTVVTVSPRVFVSRLRSGAYDQWMKKAGI